METTSLYWPLYKPSGERRDGHAIWCKRDDGDTHVLYFVEGYNFSQLRQLGASWRITAETPHEAQNASSKTVTST